MDYQSRESSLFAGNLVVVVLLGGAGPGRGLRLDKSER